MNRALFITIGIVLILFVLALWLWLFFYGTPTNTREVFSDLGLVETRERTLDPQTDGEREPGNVVLDISESKLQQITTAPVAGYKMATSTDGRPLLRYAERGTGHLYEVNLNSGLQTQLLPSTVPNTIAAYFAPDLKSLVLVSEQAERFVTVLKIPNNAELEVERFALDPDAENIEYLDANTIAFTLNDFKTTKGYVYNLRDNTVSERFTLELPDARVVTTNINEVYAYPKPASKLQGAVYRVSNTITPVTELFFGLVPMIANQEVFINYVENHSYATRNTSAAQPLAVLMLPEKCANTDEVGKVWCGSPAGVSTASFVEDWYKGAVSSEDWIWEVNAADNSVRTLIIPTEEVGRQLDIINPQFDSSGERFFFQNKTDATLWLFKP